MHQSTAYLRLIGLVARWQTNIVFLPLAVVVLFNGITLLPELTIPVPSINDYAYHYMVTLRANEALSRGENLLDHWNANLELGFPTFLYYQHLPHLAAVAVNRLLLGGVTQLDAFNLVRYVLLVGFPITVYWSMRKLEFSRTAATLAAAASPLLSGDHRYGFEYDSYIWRGFGLYTQIWAMHLSFIMLACMNATLRSGKGTAQTIIATSVLLLSHFIYAYIMAINTGLMFLLGLNRRNLLRRVRRLAVIGIFTGLIASYILVTFFRTNVFLDVSPYLQPYKFDSFGIGKISGWLVKGELLDHGRLPVLTALMAVGIIVALRRRTAPDRLCLVMLAAWLLLYSGRHTWGSLADLMPLSKGLLYHRFIGGMEIAIIPLIGVGGEAVWRLLSRTPRVGAVLPAIVLLAVLYPAMRERNHFYGWNKLWLEQTHAAIALDTDGRAILDELKTLPPGRTYAGIRGQPWIAPLMNGFVSFPDRLTFEGIDAVSSPYGGLSLNSDILWDFDQTKLSYYQMFDVRYVVAPTGVQVPPFLDRMQGRGRYTLYSVPAPGGYFAFGDSLFETHGNQKDFHKAERFWFNSAAAARGEFPVVDFDGVDSTKSDLPQLSFKDVPELYNNLPTPTTPAKATITETLAISSRHAATIDVQQPGYAVLKVTYHPNWVAYVDGKKTPTYQVMPSFVAVPLGTGSHTVEMVYVPSSQRRLLFYFGLFAFSGVIVYALFETRLQARRPPMAADAVSNAELASGASETDSERQSD